MHQRERCTSAARHDDDDTYAVVERHFAAPRSAAQPVAHAASHARTRPVAGPDAHEPTLPPPVLHWRRLTTSANTHARHAHTRARVHTCTGSTCHGEAGAKKQIRTVPTCTAYYHAHVRVGLRCPWQSQQRTRAPGKCELASTKLIIRPHKLMTRGAGSRATLRHPTWWLPSSWLRPPWARTLPMTQQAEMWPGVTCPATSGVRRV